MKISMRDVVGVLRRHTLWRRCAPVTFTSVVLLAFPSTAQQDIPRGAEELRLNENRGTAAGSRPVVLTFADNNIVVLWEDYFFATVAFQHSVIAQRLRFPSIDGPNVPLTATDGFASNPDAAARTDGSGFDLVWQEYSPTITGARIMLARFDTLCGKAGSAVAASIDSSDFPSYPRLAKSSGYGVIAWQQGAGKTSVLIRTFDDLLNPLSGAVGQNSAPSLSALRPSIAMHPDGTSQVIWIDKGEFKRSILMQRNSVDAVKLGGNMRVTSFQEDLQTGHPEIHRLPSGQMFCAWADTRDTSWAVYGQFIGEDGLIEGGNIRVSRSIPPEILADVSVCSNRDGEILVAWESSLNGYGTLAGQWIDPDGTMRGENFHLVERGHYDSRRPSLRGTDRHLYLAWLDNRFTDSPAQFDVFVKGIEPPAGTSVRARQSSHPARPYLTNHPNPFREATRVSLPPPVNGHTGSAAHYPDADPRAGRRSAALFKLYDMLGREVLDLTRRFGDVDHVTIHGDELPSTGSYLVWFSDGEIAASRIITYIR